MRNKAQQAAIAELKRAQKAVKQAENAVETVERKRLIPAIRAANAVGIPLRDIGEILGVSHVTVMRMMQ